MPFYHAGKSPDDDTKQALTGDVGRACAAAASGEIGFLWRARVDWGDVLRKAVARRFVGSSDGFVSAVSALCGQCAERSGGPTPTQMRKGGRPAVQARDTGGTRGMTS